MQDPLARTLFDCPRMLLKVYPKTFWKGIVQGRWQDLGKPSVKRAAQGPFATVPQEDCARLSQDPRQSLLTATSLGEICAKIATTSSQKLYEDLCNTCLLKTDRHREGLCKIPSSNMPRGSQPNFQEFPVKRCLQGRLARPKDVRAPCFSAKSL